MSEASAGQSVESAEPTPARAAAPAVAPEGEALTGTPQADCYREDAEEPAKEPENEPPEPETTGAEEKVESESPEAEDRDDCPIESAVKAAAPEGAAGAVGAGPGGPPTGAEAAAGAPEQVPGTTGVAGDAVSSVAGGQAEARAPLDGAINQIEGARGAAVDAYTGSAATLAATGAGLGALEVPVTFAEEPTPTPATAERQAAAQDRVGSFLADGNRQLAETVSFAQETVPGRIGGAAESIKGSIASSAEAQKASIVATVADASQRALARAAATRAQITAAHTSSVVTIEQEATGSLAALAAAHRQTLAAVDQREAQALQTINTLYADGRTAHERLGPALAAVAVARGEQYARLYERCKIHRKDGFWAGHLTDRRAEAQQNAARETAKGYSKSLIETANKQAREATKGRKKDRCGVIAAARSARETADAQLAALTTGIQDARAQAIRQAAATRAHLLAAVGSAQTATMATLRRQEQQQRQAAEDVGYLQQTLIEQVAHAGSASVQASVAQGAAVVANTLGQAHQAFAAGPAPTGEELDAGVGAASSALRGGITGLAGQAEAGVGGVETRLMTAGLAAQAALDGVTRDNQEQTAAQSSGFSQIATDLASNGVAAFAVQTGAFVSRTQQTTEQGIAGFQQVTAGFNQACTTIAEQITTALANSVVQLRQSLRTSLAGIDSRTSGIPKQAYEAASHEQPAWKSVLKWVLIIAIIVVVAVVAGPAVIGAVGAAAASLGAGAAAAGVIGTVVGGAIVGAATSATIQVVSNVAEGRTWHQGIGRAAIMGAIGGAFGAGAGALIGKYVTGAVFQVAANVAADSVLEIGTQLVTGNFSWEALGMAVVMSAATGGFGELGGVKRIQSRFSYKGARVVPGEGARAYAEGLRPHVPSTEAAPGPRTTETAPEVRGEAPGETAAEPHGPREAPRVEEGEAGGRVAHPDKPEVEPGVVATAKTADGRHDIKVNRDGSVDICTDCAKVRERYGVEIDRVPEFRAEIDRIEAIADPEVKASECTKLQDKLSQARETNLQPPRDPTGAVDFDAWGVRIKNEGVTGDIDGIVTRAKGTGTDAQAAQGELRALERALLRGHAIEVLTPPTGPGAVKGELSPEARLTRAGETGHLEVKTATEPPSEGTINAHVDHAHDQIAQTGGHGELTLDWTGVEIRGSDFPGETKIHNYINGKMTDKMMTRLRYFEIVWRRFDGRIMVTSRSRGADGRVSKVETNPL